jgi:hypothetical protein
MSQRGGAGNRGDGPTLELDVVCDEGYPGGSGIPACFDLEAGGFLSSRAHVGIIDAVVSADILYSFLGAIGDATRRRRTRGQCDVRFELASKLPPRLN